MTRKRLFRTVGPALALFIVVFALYALTVAPGTLFGDPSEYQFIPAVLGIAHPPGYAFYTLIAKAWQILVPLGSIAYRTNLLASAAGAWVATAVYLIVRDLIAHAGERDKGAFLALVPALFAALNIAVAPDVWQHSIHSNAHIISTALAATHLWLLVRWWRTGKDAWLAAFAVTVGWAATQHPITMMGVPAYGVFILIVRPTIFRQWKTMLLLIGCALLGLTPLLYFPLRSPTAPFDPPPMYTWEGFISHLTARGLRVNLFHFGLADQPDRAHVLWSILRIQFALPVIALIAAGFVWLAKRATKVAVLLGLYLLVHLGFTLNTVQDVMAYLQLPFVAFALASGAGVLGLFTETPLLRHREQGERRGFREWGVVLFLLVWPFLQATVNLEQGISLQDFTEAEEWVETVEERFVGSGEGAILLCDGEHLTPLRVHQTTHGLALKPEDVTPVYVSTARPWAESVWAYIDEGPIYLPDYRPAVRNAGFRLIPEGELFRVAAPPVTDPAPSKELDVWADDRVHILGYDLPQTEVRAGAHLPLTLYQSVTQTLEGIWMPYAQLGPVEDRWTTDSRLLTPQWQPNEVVVERYELIVPFNLEPGTYPLRLGYADLSGGRPELPLSSGGTTIELATIEVLPRKEGPSERVLDRAVANLDNQIGLMAARARSGLQLRTGPWEKPLAIDAGGPLHLTLTWRALTSPRESHTVFIHLLDGSGQYVFGHDYTPLGGAAPTYLWFPKWLPGQTYTDPYRLVIPDTVPPGQYWIEVGMYGMTSLRRLPMVDLAGNLVGDRTILGPIEVR